MKNKYILPILLMAFAGNAQVSLSTGDHNVEISGSTSIYYNHRMMKETETDYDKNRFKIRDAIIQIEGRIKDTWEYEFQADFADIVLSSTDQVDPENPGLMDAYVIYKGLEAFDIKAGYGKLPYSRSSMTPFNYSTYWQRAELVRDGLFSRRDVGVTLSKSMWQQRINIDAGIYTGLGEMSLRGDNDASGNPEFVGRMEFSYPSRFRYREIDERHSPIPLFSVGINGRYTNREMHEGESFPDGAQGEYGLKLVNGKKYTYGFDVAFQYQGFSALFEMHQIKGEPSYKNDPQLMGIPYDQAEGYFLAGGYLAQASYFFKDIKTIISARYEEMDLNDLVKGKSKRFSPAIAYQISGFDAMIKFQYFNILEEESIDPLKWTEQFRIGLQLKY